MSCMNIFDDFYEKKSVATFGIAGNFTGHLEQAGEAVDFVNLKTEGVDAPKGVFPTFLPEKKENTSDNLKKIPVFLHEFPFDSKKIIFPEGEEKIQIEPECAVIFEAEWKEDELVNLKPLVFGASNDCSIRKQGAKKISEKKNWGCSSKGLSENLIALDGFSKKSNLNDFRIASFLIRDKEVFQYGEDSAVRNYSYIYEKLVSWLLLKFNSQKNEGPLEDIHEYLLESLRPKKIMVSVGATRYTKWGETNFLQNGDMAVVAVYPESKYSETQIFQMVKDGKFDAKDISFLCQSIVK